MGVRNSHAERTRARWSVDRDPMGLRRPRDQPEVAPLTIPTAALDADEVAFKANESLLRLCSPGQHLWVALKNPLETLL